MMRFALPFVVVGVLAACAAEPQPAAEPQAAAEPQPAAGPPPAALESDPAAGSAVAPFTTVRVWFSEGTDLDASELALEGPEGGVALMGVHSMGEGDLMAMVEGETPAGGYTLTWTAAGAGGATATGTVEFTVE